MIIKDTESVDIHTSTGPMRTYLFRPAAEGRELLTAQGSGNRVIAWYGLSR